MAINICKDCDSSFDSKGRNALYCPSCARERKRECDREAWKRRRKKAYNAKKTIPDALEMRLSKIHAAELGISQLYYNLWKEQNPKSYRKWMEEKIKKERVRQ